MIQITKGQTFTAQLTVMRTQDATTTQFLLSGCRDLAFNAVGRERQYALDGFTYKDNILTATVNTALLDEGIYTLTARGRYMGDWWRAKTVALFEVVATGGELPTEPVGETATAVFSLHQEVPGILTRLQTLETKPAGVTPEDLQELKDTLVTQITEAQRQAVKEAMLASKADSIYQSVKEDTSGAFITTALQHLDDYTSKATGPDWAPEFSFQYAFYKYAYQKGLVNGGIDSSDEPDGTWADTNSGTYATAQYLYQGYKVATYIRDSLKFYTVNPPASTKYFEVRNIVWLMHRACAMYGWQTRFSSSSGPYSNLFIVPNALVCIDLGTETYEDWSFYENWATEAKDFTRPVSIIRCPNLIEKHKQSILNIIGSCWQQAGDYLVNTLKVS